MAETQNVGGGAEVSSSEIQVHVKKALDWLKNRSGVSSVNGQTGAVTVKTGKNVGDEWHSFTGQIPVGGVPYCGQEVTRATYADLWTWVQAQGLVKTEDEWQALATSQNGNVPYYSSGDGSTTFRMPKIVGYIKGAASQSEAGAYTSEGLPNITGRVGNTGTEIYETSGALYSESAGGVYRAGATGDFPDSFSFDASRCSSVYGNSDHVTPETSVVLFGVYAFGEITNVGSLDADTLATGLAAVESNLSTKLESSTVHIVDSWIADDGSQWYRKWSDGWIEQGGVASGAGSSGVTGMRINFPMAFSSHICGISAIVSSGTDGYANEVVYGVKYVPPSLTYVSFSTSYTNQGLSSYFDNEFYWSACGY